MYNVAHTSFLAAILLRSASGGFQFWSLIRGFHLWHRRMKSSSEVLCRP